MKQTIKIIPFKLWVVIAVFLIGSVVELFDAYTAENIPSISELSSSIFGVGIASGLFFRINLLRWVAVIFLAIQMIILFYIGSATLIMSFALAFDIGGLSLVLVFIAVIFIAILSITIWMIAYLLSDEVKAIFISESSLWTQDSYVSKNWSQKLMSGVVSTSSKIRLLNLYNLRKTIIGLAIILLLFMPYYLGMGLFHLSLMPNNNIPIETVLAEKYDEHIALDETTIGSSTSMLFASELIYGYLLLGLSMFFLIISILLFSGKYRRLFGAIFIISFSASWIGVELYGYIYDFHFLQSFIVSTLIPIIIASLLLLCGIYILLVRQELESRSQNT